jgi:hypothetical protein
MMAAIIVQFPQLAPTKGGVANTAANVRVLDALKDLPKSRIICFEPVSTPVILGILINNDQHFSWDFYLGDGVSTEFGMVPSYCCKVGLVGSGKYLLDCLGHAGAYLAKAIAAMHNDVEFSRFGLLD